jgi:serine phosphatase RsbU (regulator of sigma subunit)/predicted enzyme related to lactoylglutathione lyase
VHLFVRDQDRTLRFLTEQLGFKLLFDADTENVGRFVAVAAPDGATFLGLIVPRPGSPEYELIGRSGHVVLATEDIAAQYEEWTCRGVVFAHAPRATNWGGAFTTFTDPDGNSFALMSQDGVSRQLEALRRAAAERAEAERRAAREMEIAREVQSRLLPQIPPPSRTLDLSGRCLQARQVGGDYFDFLRLGDDRLGIVVGDISGKGIAAALLMANLQASVRSQSAIAPDDPHRFLLSLNQHFVANSAPAAYASLFFAEWSEESGRLRYVNCGHPPPLVLRRDGRIDELKATSTVLGLFGDWECATAETTVAQGETLVIYTDGVTEWVDAQGAEFGSDRLGEEVRRGTTLGAAALLDRIIAALRELGGEGQRDDVTLLVAKRRSG